MDLSMVPVIRDKTHLKFLLFVVAAGLTISLFTFFFDAEHRQVGIAILLLAVFPYALWRRHPLDDCYAILFWLAVLIGISSILPDIKDLI